MKSFRGSLAFSLILLVLAGGGCATQPVATETVSPTAVAKEATPGGLAAAAWTRTELYFAIGDWTETALNTEAELRWATFLDAEVTPRFPDGLSVLDVYGQWRDAKPGSPVKRERSRLLVVMHPATAEAGAKIEAIRAAWKQQAGEKSVLRVSQPAEVGF